VLELMKRKATSLEVKQLVLHEAGYKCANPTCRHVLTLDVHHLINVSDEGPNTAENLLPLCPNCHALHHRGEIPIGSLRSWKMLLITLNEAFDRKAVDVLLALDKLAIFKRVTGDGVIGLASLVAAGLVEIREYYQQQGGGGLFHVFEQMYLVELSDKGKSLVAGWKKGDQSFALGGSEKS
jgi:hypothetical protein